jgi:hypothetical protein
MSYFSLDQPKLISKLNIKEVEPKFSNIKLDAYHNKHRNCSFYFSKNVGPNLLSVDTLTNSEQ